MKRIFSFLLTLALLTGLLLPTTLAATTVVTSYSDLVAAIAAAPTNGTVTTIELENSFSATGGAITIASGQNIVLTSTASSTFTFTQATSGQRHFSVAGSLTLQNVTLSGPGGGTTVIMGGVDVSGGTLTLGSGGTITNCRAPGSNSAYYGGGVNVHNGGTLVINGGTISNNATSWVGGGVLLTGNSTFIMNSGTISGNVAVTSGGGVSIQNGNGTISGGSITGNMVTSSSSQGGGIALSAASLTITGGYITNNRANNGGGIYTDASGAINMSAGTISNNVAITNGGGIFTAQYTTNNPLPPNSYINLVIGSSVVFMNNVAGTGARIPPTNAGPPNTNISTTSSSTIFGNPLNNLDINYFGSPGVMVTYLTVTFDPGIGTFPSGTQTQQSVPTTNSPLVPTSVPSPQPPTNYGFIGWVAMGGSGAILTSAQVLTTPIGNNTTYVAQYAPPISLIFNWQDNAIPTTQTVTPVQVTGTYASALLQATTPTRLGYVFRGWFTTPNGSVSGVQILPTSIVAIGTPNPTTLYAWWIQDPTVAIIFDGNNGTPTEQVVSGRVIGDSYAATFAAVTTPTRLGYSFVGWFTAASGGTQVFGTDIILGATTLYAQWMQVAPITITYDAMGGVPDGQEQIVVTGDIYGDALPAISPPTQPGLAFAGWFTAPTGGVQILPSTIVTTTSDQTLYAQWIAVTVTITFDSGGGAPATQVVSGLAPLTSYAPVLAAISTPTRAGYTFSGWHDAPQGQGGSSVTSGSLIPPINETVYAWWTPNPTITVTFNAMGGSPTMETELVAIGGTYATALAAVTEPTLAGSTFVGWFTDPTGGVQILDTTVVTVTTNQILYAHWVPITVTVYFDSQGGTPAMQGVTGQPIGSTYQSALNAITTPTQIGYTFNGWNTASDGSGAMITASSIIPNENTTIYAQWIPLPPITITFDSQGGEFDQADVILGSGVTLSSDWKLAYYYPAMIGGTFLHAMSATPDPYPPDDGYTYSFGGWWTAPIGDPSGSGVQVLPTDTVTEAMLDSSGDNITLYVHWITVPTVTLTFDAQGGTPATQVRRGAVVGDDIDASLFIQDPTRVGYTFTGWFPTSSGGLPILDTYPIPSVDTTYYAQWTQIPPINVYFDAQGGSFDPAYIIPGAGTTLVSSSLARYYPVTVGGTFLQAMSATPNPNPPSNAYSFGGWWTSEDGVAGGVQVLPTSTVWNEPGDITLFAHWIPVPMVTITFDGNGGTPPTQIVPGQFPNDTYATALASVTTPIQNGFTFDGWVDENEIPITSIRLIPSEDTTVYAQWTQNPPITVTFDAQGGTPTGETEDVTTGGTYAAALTAVTNPTLSGFLFQGWFTEPVGTAGGIQVLYTTIVTATTDQILYAHWIADPTITITFNGNGGTPASQVLPGRVSGNTFASTLTAITTPTQAGYVFTGWFTSPTAGTQITAFSIIPAGDIPRTVYAHWAEIPTIVVTFDAQGGTPTGQEETIETGAPYGNILSDVPDPTRLGYVFGGWFTTPDGDTSGVQILPNTTVTAITDQTLYAHWIAVTVTITFDAQGGTPTIQVAPGKIYGNSYSNTLASVADPTMAFYTFLGWFTYPINGAEITAADTIPMTDTTLYAHWAPVSVTLTFDALGAAPAVQEESATAGDSFAAPLAAVTRPSMTDNTFVGWFTQIIGGTQVQPGDIVTQDQTLYAQFAPTPPTPPFTPPIPPSPPSTPPTPQPTPPTGQGPVFREDVTLTDIHHAYLIGENASLIAPTSAITRAEVASVILRIVSDETRTAYWTLDNPFPDVPNNGGAWFSNAVSVVNKMGIMTGLPNGTFGPNRHITRAEVVTVMTRFLSAEMQYSGTVDPFPDISTHWARNSINLATELSWVQGYPDGNFYPNANITRAEFATMVNRMLSRTVADLDTANMRTWTDNTDTNEWFYWAIQIASNAAPDAPYRNWVALQLPNARPGDVLR